MVLTLGHGIMKSPQSDVLIHKITILVLIALTSLQKPVSQKKVAFGIATDFGSGKYICMSSKKQE